MTREEFDLLERTISAYEVDPRGLALPLGGSDVETAKGLEARGYIEVIDEWAFIIDAGLIAANDFLGRFSGSHLLHDPLTTEEFALLDKVIESERDSGPYEVADTELPIAQVLAARRLIRLDGRSAEPERRGYRAHDEHQTPAYESAGEVLERLLASFASSGKFPLPALFGLLMRQRQNLGRNLQRWVEDRSPLGTPREGGRKRQTSRPYRWHITQAGHLRIDGIDVASGPTRRLRGFGAFLHDMGYPKVRAQHLHTFKLHQPGEAQAPVGREPLLLSGVTIALIEGLSADGGTAKRAGVYLGLSEEQWRRHQGPESLREDRRPGPWATHVLRILPAHPRVITWVLELEEPLGRGVVTDLLEHLHRHGLASKQGADWHRTPAGSHAIQSEELIDPFEEWVDRHDAAGRSSPTAAAPWSSHTG